MRPIIALCVLLFVGCESKRTPIGHRHEMLPPGVVPATGTLCSSLCGDGASSCGRQALPDGGTGYACWYPVFMGDAK